MVTLTEISGSINKTGKYWIVFTGDSITSCEWVHPNWREIVEYVLKEEMTKVIKDWRVSSWGIRTFNFAYDGSTSQDLLERVEAMKTVNPDLVVNVGGGNDPVFKIGVNEHVENIKKIVEKLDTQVVWGTSTPAARVAKKNIEYAPYAKATIEILPTPGLQLIDMFSIYQNFPLEKFFTFKSEENTHEGIKEGEVDFWHPNQLGNAYIAKVILKEVFGIEFDPEKYWKSTLAGEKFPEY